MHTHNYKKQISCTHIQIRFVIEFHPSRTLLKCSLLGSDSGAPELLWMSQRRMMTLGAGTVLVGGGWVYWYASVSTVEQARQARALYVR